MRVVNAARAAAILYGLLVSQRRRLPWLIPANICPIVPITFLKAGVPFELVDISTATLHMDLELATERLACREFGGVLYAHTYGEPSTPLDFFALAKAKQPELVVVDDRCLCRPDLTVPAALVPDVVLYSTGYAKPVDLGFGGYAFIRNDIEYALPSLPFTPESYASLEVAYKSSVRERTTFVYRDSDWLQTTSTGPLQPYLQQIAAAAEQSDLQRARISRIYAELLPEALQLPPAYQSWRFNLRVKDRALLLKTIFSANLFASAHYASLGGIMAPGRCPVAEGLAAEVVNLFIDRNVTEDQAEKLSLLVRAHSG